MDDLYTCKECGCHKFFIEHICTEGKFFESFLQCTCEASHGKAAIEQNYSVNKMRDWSYLDDGHRYKKWEEGEELEGDIERDEDPKIYCRECFENASFFDWTDKIKDLPDIVREKYYVRCDACKREIEFGWSHPEDGRVWTVEDKDFNPWHCFPDTRYREKWKARGWLRPPRLFLACKSCNKSFWNDGGGVYKGNKIYCKCGYCFGNMYDTSIGTRK